ncbi:hypothetical protein Taro_010985 [Colocasia esculenta]|uniref:Uncharacterized protein n=1 Tax=Colocasia esculenta TaxID=4460 RepID=A0A843UBA9_COLES|nr:hypothetical protein [Colocasia esculenta]
MLPSSMCSVSPVSGRFPEEESPEPPTGLKATYPVSPPDWTRVEDKTSVDAPDRESSQQQQGARRAEETGR